MVAGALVVVWFVVSGVLALLVGAAIHQADIHGRREYTGPVREVVSPRF